MYILFSLSFYIYYTIYFIKSKILKTMKIWPGTNYPIYHLYHNNYARRNAWKGLLIVCFSTIIRYTSTFPFLYTTQSALYTYISIIYITYICTPFPYTPFPFFLLSISPFPFFSFPLYILYILYILYAIAFPFPFFSVFVLPCPVIYTNIYTNICTNICTYNIYNIFTSLFVNK